MPRIRLIHWKSGEAAPLVDALRHHGHTVDYAERVTSGLVGQLRAARPDALVIDLSRLPSHGKALAILVRRAKQTRDIPFIFHGGLPEKTASLRELFPDDVFVPSLERLRAALANLRPVRPKDTPLPVGSIANPNRTAAEKLGIRTGAKVGVLDPPREYLRTLGKLPDGVEFNEDGPAAGLLLWFVHDAREFASRLPEARKWAASAKLWVLWRKQATGKSVLTQQEIRRVAGEFGLVDYKICSVDEAWSGMLFAARK